MSNRRIFYAITQLGIKPDGEAGQFDEVHGVQSCGITTNYNLNELFQLGEISQYANVEELPDVQLTMSKVLDGYPLLYLLATQDAPNPTLVGRSVSNFVAALAIFADTSTHATGEPGSEVVCSGQFPASVSYAFSVDDWGMEEFSSAGNSKVWANDTNIAMGTSPPPSFSGAFNNDDSPPGIGGAVRRNSIYFETSMTGVDVNGAIVDPDATILPREIHGIQANGVNPLGSDGFFVAHLQSITASVDLNRQAINHLGQLGPYTRFANFPVEVTCEVTVISVSGDMVSATENGIYSTGVGCADFNGNLRNGTIRIATCEGTRVYLGTKNKLQSISYAGGDTGGGNVTVTYSFRNFNDFTVMHIEDPHPSGEVWWPEREDFLVN